MKVRIPGSCSGVFGLPIAALVLTLSGMGCTSSRPAASASAPPRTAPAIAAITPASAVEPSAEDEAQRGAQHAWCTYLEALYLRATDGAKTWPKRGQCEIVRTPAAPGMLQRTAECSMAALQKFEGDPFTSAYAAEVTRCGHDSLDATTIPLTDLAPYARTICARAVACGKATEVECLEALAATLAPNLCRAIGAINQRGRSELRACLDSAACDAMSEQITGCLTPIMDRLLWLPE